MTERKPKKSPTPPSKAPSGWEATEALLKAGNASDATMEAAKAAYDKGVEANQPMTGEVTVWKIEEGPPGIHLPPDVVAQIGNPATLSYRTIRHKRGPKKGTWSLTI